MKRSPLARRGALKRGGELRRTGSLKRTVFKRAAALARKSPPRQRGDEAARKEFFRRTKFDSCIVCMAPWPEDPHHVIPKELLKRWGLALWDLRNRVWVCRRCHDRHESAYRRIPRYLLPARVFAFIDGLGPHAEKARAYLERTYPEL